MQLLPLLNCRVAGLCKDYCGILNEEAIRLNFVLIYELLDEVMVSRYLATMTETSVGASILDTFCISSGT